MSPFGQAHLQDGVPLTFNEEFSGYMNQISMNIEGLMTWETCLYPLSINDTTVRTARPGNSRFRVIPVILWKQYSDRKFFVFFR
jgi:fumarate hydratase class II